MCSHFQQLTQELYSTKNLNEKLTANLKHAEEEIAEYKADLIKETLARQDVEETVKSQKSQIITNKQQVIFIFLCVTFMYGRI